MLLVHGLLVLKSLDFINRFEELGTWCDLQALTPDILVENVEYSFLGGYDPLILINFTGIRLKPIHLHNLLYPLYFTDSPLFLQIESLNFLTLLFLKRLVTLRHILFLDWIIDAQIK